jgi:hypothetical protein
MPIISDTPLTTPAVAPKTFDTWWQRTLLIDAENANGPVSARIVFRLQRWIAGTAAVVADPNATPPVAAVAAVPGKWESYLDADGNEMLRQMDISDLFGLAAENADVAAQITSLLALAGALAKANGVIS